MRVRSRLYIYISFCFLNLNIPGNRVRETMDEFPKENSKEVLKRGTERSENESAVGKHNQRRDCVMRALRDDDCGFLPPHVPRSSIRVTYS